MGQHDTHRLLPGVSETLQCNPVRKLLRMVVVGKSGAVEKAGNVIHLHFEGNWMPIKARTARSVFYAQHLPCTPCRSACHQLRSAMRWRRAIKHGFHLQPVLRAMWGVSHS